MNYPQFFRTLSKQLVAEYAEAGIALSRRRFLDEVKERLTQKQWDAIKSKIDQTKAGLPHHHNLDYDRKTAQAKIIAWKEARYVFMYGPMKCVHCGANQGPIFEKFVTLPATDLMSVANYCSASCSKANDATVAKRYATNLKRYGTENIADSKHFRKKIKQAHAEGAYSNAQERREQTQIEMYGSVEQANTLRAAKMVKTNQERYGGNAATCSPKVRARVRATVRKRYGVDNVTQSLEVKRKIDESWRRSKTLKVKGKTFTGLQGYEPQVVAWFVRNGTKVKHITNEVAPIRYEWDGRTRMYFPDLASTRSNTLVEVKSSWTAALYGDSSNGHANYKLNRAKVQAAHEAGFKVLFIIYHEKTDDCFVWEGKLPRRKELRKAWEAWLALAE